MKKKMKSQRRRRRRRRVQTSEGGAHLPDRDGTFGGELTQGQLQEEERQSGNGQHDDVGEEERGCHTTKQLLSSLVTYSVSSFVS